MARKATKTTKKEETKTAAEDPKYGVADLVEASELQPASVRVALRDLGVEKNFGNKYGWDTKKDFDEIVKALKERSAKRIATKSDDKPAAKAKSTRKTRSKKAA